MRLTLAFALSLLSCAGSEARRKASLDSAHQVAVASDANGPGNKGKYVCEYEEHVGSHIPGRVCRYVDDETEGTVRLQRMSTQINLDAASNKQNLPSQ